VRPGQAGITRGETGTGVFATAAGMLVFLCFLMFAVELLLGLHAATVVTSVANDTARRAAADGAPPRGVLEADLASSLGRMGERAEITWGSEPDVVVLSVAVTPPRFVPASIGGAVGLDRVERTVRVRQEGFADGG
jgi:hypothetical protein